MTDQDFAQGTEGWLNQRTGKITCSRYKDVLAFNTRTYVDNAENRKLGRAGTTVVTELQDRRDYMVQVALERITGTSTPMFENFAMRAGTEREPSARRVYEYRQGWSVEECGFIPHALYPFTGGSPDGVMVFEDGDRGDLEIKCPQLEQHFDNLCAIEAGVLPEKYRAQVQGIMWVTACKWLDWCSFNPEFPPHLEFGCLRVERDEEYIATLESAVLQFESEVCALVDRLMRMNGGPIAVPVRLRDLDCNPEPFEEHEFHAAIEQIRHTDHDCHLFNDDFDPLSWIYSRSELRPEGAFHVFTRGEEVAVAVASDEWVERNRL